MSTDKHPIMTMAAPTAEDMQATLVDLAWRSREDAGTCERHLDSDAPDVDFTQIVHPGQLASMATTCNVLALSLGAAEAAALFAAATTHFGSAAAHLMGHMTYDPLLTLRPGVKYFEEHSDDERRFAARATKLGRQLTHRGLSKLAEMWPHAYKVDDEAVGGDDE